MTFSLLSQWPADGCLLVADLEATCDECDPGWCHEIIEIGAVLVDRQGGVVATYQALVHPALNPVLTPFCQRLTGISQEQVDGAQPLSAGLAGLGAFIQGVPVLAWATWGASDAKLLEAECGRHGLANPLGALEHVNLKRAFAKARKIKQVGLKKAVELAGLPEPVVRHRALADAEAAASLLPLLGANQKPKP